MSYQERRAIVALLSTLVITAIYSAVMFQRYPDVSETGAYSPEIFRFWGMFIVVLIPVSIVAKIIIAIVFYIINTIATREVETDLTDERDKLIELRATRNSLYVFMFGFLFAMIALALGQTPTTMFVILIIGGLLSDMVMELSLVFFYRRGY